MGSPGGLREGIDALERRAATDPADPAVYCAIARYYWDRALRNARLNADDRRAFILKGLAAADRALAITADDLEALTCKTLLLRLQTAAETHAGRQKTLVAEADRLRARAVALQKKKTAGLG